MAEECPTLDVATLKEVDTPMECETSEPQSMKTPDSSSDKGVPTLPPSGATSAAASTPMSESECAMNPEDVGVKGESSECATSPGDTTDVKQDSTLSAVSGAASAAVLSSAPDSECAMSTDDALLEKGALSLSDGASAAVSEVLKSTADKTVKVATDCSVSPDTSASFPASGSTEGNEECSISPDSSASVHVTGSSQDKQEILSPAKVAELMSPDKEKVGLFKGVKTAIKSKVKSVWKKLSPKKPEKAALAFSSQEAESAETSATGTEKKPYKSVTYVSATRSDSLVLHSTASDEVTLDTDLPTSSSEVFAPDQESIATATHASRLPSLAGSGSEPSQDSPEHNADDSPGDRGDEAMDDGKVAESS